MLLIAQIGFTINLRMKAAQYAAFTPDAPFVSVDTYDLDQFIVVGREGNTVRLIREGGKWILPDYFNADANGNQVAKILKNITDARQGLAVATSESGLQRFHVADDDFERHVALHSEGQKVAGFYLGSAAGLRKSHARTENSREVITVNLSTLDFGSTPEDWLDKTLVQIDKNTVHRIDFKEFSLLKKENAWLIEQEGAQTPALQEEVNALLNTLNTISIEGILAPDEAQKEGLATPALEFSVQYGKDSEQVYTLFKPEQEGDYTLQVTGHKNLFKVPTWQLEQLAGKTPEHYAPTPAPQPEETSMEAMEQAQGGKQALESDKNGDIQ